MSFLIVALTSLLISANNAPPTASAKKPVQSAGMTGDGAQHPQDKDDASAPPQTPEQKAAGAAYQDYMHSVLQSLRNSASPRDRAIASQTGFFADIWDGREATPAEKAQRGAVLRAAAEAAPDDALVQLLWVRANLEDSGCNASHPCPHRFEAVVRLQPDNGSAWVPVLSAAWKSKDIPAAESALANMARASYFEEQDGTALKAWMEVFDRYPVPRSAIVPGSPEEKLDDQTIEFYSALAFSFGMVMPDYQGLVDVCRHQKHPDASPQRFRDCAQVGRLMMEHSSSIVSRQIGRALLRVSGQATAEDISNARVEDWLYEQWGNLIPVDANIEYLKKNAADWIDTGDEIKVLQREMQRKGIPLTPPTDWQPHGHDGKPISPLGEDPAR